jgi:hypothetical protein
MTPVLAIARTLLIHNELSNDVCEALATLLACIVWEDAGKGICEDFSVIRNEAPKESRHKAKQLQ